VPLAEQWDGTNWTVRPVPLPAGSLGARPGALSCPSPTRCTAVGEYFKPQSGDDFPLAERWDGTSWTVQQFPLPAGAFGAELSGVSCPSATDCTAVGNYNDLSVGGTPFAAQWNGTTWTTQTVPDPSAAALHGVSCTSPDACTAVGVFHNSTGAVPLAGRWNGTTWTVQTVPGPAGNGLANVSCPSATDCTAIGTAARTEGLAEHWDGTSWVAQTTPTPKATTVVGMFGISCLSATDCTAVGSYNERRPLAVHE
jgi:hypothetical protein